MRTQATTRIPAATRIPASARTSLSNFTNQGFVTRAGNEFRLGGSRFKFMGINKYPLFVNTMSQADIQAFFNACQNRGITVVRTWCFDVGNPPSNSAGNFRYLSGSTLVTRPEAFTQLDMILSEARQRGIRLILSLSDNPTYLTKKTYCVWANAIYGSGLATTFPYKGFFESSDCKTLYKQFIDLLTDRYKDDTAIFAWELGNELRVDDFEGANVNTLNSENLALLSNPGGWIDEMSTYIKTRDLNHLVSFSSCSHGYAFSNGDTVWNGTFYGVDYNIISALPNIDYLDFHSYPTQGGGEVNLLKYGQHFGYPNAITGDGYRRQLRDFVDVAKANGKPVVCGENGFVREVIASNTNFPLYPRVDAYKEISGTLFNRGADGIIFWHGEVNDGGSYSINLVDWNGDITNLNYNDTPFQQLIKVKNYTLNGTRVPVS